MEKMIHNRKREAKFTRIFFLAAGIFLFYQICRTVYELAAGGRELSGILFRLALIIPASVVLGVAVCIHKQCAGENLRALCIFWGTLSEREMEQVDRYLSHVEEIFGRFSLKRLACILTDEWIYQWNSYDLTLVERIYRKTIKDVYIKRERLSVPLVMIRTGYKTEKLVGTYWNMRYTCGYGGLVKVNDELFQIIKKELSAQKSVEGRV